MFATTLRSIASHKLRLLGTALAIVLGVAFVTGTYVLTDTLRQAFDEVFAPITEGVDLTVQGRTDDFTEGFTGIGRPVPHELADELAALDGVAEIDAEASGFAQIIGEDGEPVGGMGPPTLGISTATNPELSADFREGRAPTAPDEVAIDAGTAEAQGLAVGDRIDIVIDGPVTTFTVVGTIGFGELDNLAGATVVLFERDFALDTYGEDGFTAVYLYTDEGTDPADLQDDVAAIVGDDFEVLTEEELSDSITADINEGLGFFTTALLVFAAVSLFVGAFLIANTFTIIVAQRTRELALLRAVGASRRQVLGSVLGEALAVGLVGSALGLLLGLAVAQGLYALLDTFGISLPSSGLVVRSTTVVVALVVGTGVTLLAALAPALRSTRVPPVAALQAVAAPPAPRYGMLRYVAGGLVLLGGIGLLLAGLFADGGIALVGAGAAVTLLGAAFLAPLVTRPLLRLLGAPLAAARGVQGQLATENALRNPRRTAATASALMIGLALVAFMSILGASITRSAQVGIDEVFLSEFQVNPSGGFGIPGESGFSEQLIADLTARDDVAVATPLYLGQFRPEPGGSTTVLGAVEADEIGQAFGLDFLDGSFAELGEGGVAVSADLADREGLAVGDTVTVEFAATGQRDLVVRGVFDGANLDTDWLIDADTYRDNFSQLLTSSLYVKLADGVDAAQVRPELEAELAAYPTLQLQDLDEVKEQISDSIGQLLGLVSALLLLSVIIALFGIVNTLGLSVYERVREIGLLRAVGATRRQVRTMIRWESVLIALLGAVFGVVVGVLFAWMVTRALADLGISQFVIPYGQVVGGVLFAAVAGVLAAIIPARRAARTDVLRALQAE